jgi:hypothetical protein
MTQIINVYNMAIQLRASDVSVDCGVVVFTSLLLVRTDKSVAEKIRKILLPQPIRSSPLSF